MIPDRYEDFTKYALVQRVLGLEAEVERTLTVRDRYAIEVLNQIAGRLPLDLQSVHEDFKLISKLTFEITDIVMEARRERI